MKYLLLALLLLTELPHLRAQTAASGRLVTAAPDSGQVRGNTPSATRRRRWQASAGPWKTSKYRVVTEKYKPEQAPSGGLLRVQVLDYLAREPIPGARFTLTEMRTQVTRQGNTSAAGSIAEALPAGLYTLHVNSIGYHELTTAPFVVQAGYVLKLEALLGFDI